MITVFCRWKVLGRSGERYVRRRIRNEETGDSAAPAAYKVFVSLTIDNRWDLTTASDYRKKKEWGGEKWMSL
jgi:hypothetical protein